MTELSIERLHVQLHNDECPDLMLSVMVLGSATCCALPVSTIPGSVSVCLLYVIV